MEVTSVITSYISYYTYLYQTIYYNFTSCDIIMNNITFIYSHAISICYRYQEYWCHPISAILLSNVNEFTSLPTAQTFYKIHFQFLSAKMFPTLWNQSVVVICIVVCYVFLFVFLDFYFCVFVKLKSDSEHPVTVASPSAKKRFHTFTPGHRGPCLRRPPLMGKRAQTCWPEW